MPVEICEDYLLWAESYIECFAEELENEHISEIRNLFQLVDDLPESAFCDTNLKSMMRPEWEPLRKKAKFLLRLLGLAIESPAHYVDNKGDGVYYRK